MSSRTFCATARDRRAPLYRASCLIQVVIFPVFYQNVFAHYNIRLHRYTVNKLKFSKSNTLLTVPVHCYTALSNILSKCLLCRKRNNFIGHGHSQHLLTLGFQEFLFWLATSMAVNFKMAIMRLKRIRFTYLRNFFWTFRTFSLKALHDSL